MKKYLLFTIITFCALMFGLNDGLARVRLPQHIASGMVLAARAATYVARLG